MQAGAVSTQVGLMLTYVLCVFTGAGGGLLFSTVVGLSAIFPARCVAADTRLHTWQTECFRMMNRFVCQSFHATIECEPMVKRFSSVCVQKWFAHFSL